MVSRSNLIIGSTILALSGIVGFVGTRSRDNAAPIANIPSGPNILTTDLDSPEIKPGESFVSKVNLPGDFIPDSIAMVSKNFEINQIDATTSELKVTITNQGDKPARFAAFVKYRVH